MAIESRVYGGSVTGDSAEKVVGPTEQQLLAYTYAVAIAYDHFTSLSTHPISRAVESVRFQPGSLLRSITVTFDAPITATFEADDAKVGLTNLQGKIFLPLTTARRGRLLSSFEARDEQGRALQIMHRSFSKKLAQSLVGVAWDKAFGAPAVLSAELTGMRKSAMNLPLLATGEALATAEKINAKISEYSCRASSTAEKQAFLRLAALLKHAALRTIIWVAVEGRPGLTYVLSYSYESPYGFTGLAAANKFDVRDHHIRNRAGLAAAVPSWILHVIFWFDVLIRAANQNGEALEFIRRHVGQLPNKLIVPIGMPHMAESYHFRAEIPPANFVTDQRFLVRDTKAKGTHKAAAASLDADDGTELPRLDFAETFGAQHENHGADFRGHDVVGGSFGHLYTYKIRGEPHRLIYASIEFDERPPGTLGTCLTLSRLAFTVNLFLVIFFPLLLQLSNSAVDVVSISLTVPLFATVWFGRNINWDSDTAARAPILARAALLICGSSSATNSLALMLAIAVRQAVRHSWYLVGIFWLIVCVCLYINWKLVRLLSDKCQERLRIYREAQSKLPTD